MRRLQVVHDGRYDDCANLKRNPWTYHEFKKSETKTKSSSKTWPGRLKPKTKRKAADQKNLAKANTQKISQPRTKTLSVRKLQAKARESQPAIRPPSETTTQGAGT
eukprot:scaffold315165_cov24-Prasinocladus_malaysianus.AAC.1